MAAAKKKAKSKPKPRKAPAKKAAAPKKSAAKKPAPTKKAAPKKPASRAAAPKPEPRTAPKAAPRPTPKAAPRPVPKPAAPARPQPLPGEEPVGTVTHYYGHLGVAVIRLETGTLRVGETIRILGHTTDLRQKIQSLQIDREAVDEVSRGRIEFGMKVAAHVREHDVVYKVT